MAEGHVTPQWPSDEFVQTASPRDWVEYIISWAATKGWNHEKTEAEWAALAHSEISEAFEAFRDGKVEAERMVYVGDGGKPEGMAVEYADCLIRIFHWFGAHGIDVNEVLAMKMRYNETRPYRHGGKAC